MEVCRQPSQHYATVGQPRNGADRGERWRNHSGSVTEDDFEQGAADPCAAITVPCDFPYEETHSGRCIPCRIIHVVPVTGYIPDCGKKAEASRYSFSQKRVTLPATRAPRP